MEGMSDHQFQMMLNMIIQIVELSQNKEEALERLRAVQKSATAHPQDDEE